jgi:steroid delta-isomerase-like uncharacterized protein
MYARVSSLAVPPERMKEARRALVHEALPAARGLPGRRQTVWLSDETSGTVLVVSLYDTEEHMVANRQITNEIRQRSARNVGGNVSWVREFEVIGEASGMNGIEENKRLARRIYEEVLNERRLDLLDELVRPDYVEHDPLPGQREGIDGIRDRYAMLIEGLDPHFTIEDVIAEHDKVVVRWTNSGTNVGDFLGAPATNRPFSTPGIDIYRVEDGKLAEHWHVVDVYVQMVQLGQLPPPPGM